MEKPNYPFLKLTRDEKFPRLLATRKPQNKLEKQMIYGAFLPTGMLRRLIDLLARSFRLRPCELEIRGDFESPCPEYFLRHCLAPCVAEICDRPTYLEAVETVHLILSDQTEKAFEKLDAKIQALAGELEFEKAADLRDTRRLIEEISLNAKWQIDISAMNDVITLTVEDKTTFLHLTTLRRGKIVGRLDFAFEAAKTSEEILTEFIAEFYRFHAPKQIFAPFDFPARKMLEKNLSARFERKIKIAAEMPEKLPPTVLTARRLAPHSFSRRSRQNFEEKTKLLSEIQRFFELEKIPRRIECFDVAHLDGREIVAARVVSVDGFLQNEDGLVWEFENLSETEALASAVRERLRLLPFQRENIDLLIVDGGKAQINAVSEVLKEFELSNLSLVGAVKPSKSHHRISHFLINDSFERIEFENRSKSMNFLLNLRDASHALANETHRRLRSLAQIFKNNETAPQIKYLLVPIRYTERGGGADDLQPIRSINTYGEIIQKTRRK